VSPLRDRARGHLAMQESVPMKWQPLTGSTIRLARLPGWFLQLTHNGNETLGVWSNGRAVFTVRAAAA
jgi:hypothetical protein